MNKIIIYVATIFILFLISLFIPPNSYVFSLLILIGIYTLAALGLELLMGFGGQISLGNGGFIAAGAYITAVFSNYNVHPILTFIFALVGTAIIAVIVGSPILRLEGYYLAIATLGFALLIQAFAVAALPLTGGSSGITLPALRIFQETLTERDFFYLTSFILLLGFWFAKNLSKTRLGRSLIAIQSNEDAASALGIHSQRIKLLVFVISAVYAAAAGFIWAYYLQFISPGIFSLTLSVDLIVISLLGGHGFIFAPIIGSIVWVTLKELTHMFQDYHILMTGIALILIIRFFPKGIWSIVNKYLFGSFEKLKSNRKPILSLWKGKLITKGTKGQKEV